MARWHFVAVGSAWGAATALLWAASAHARWDPGGLAEPALDAAARASPASIPEIYGPGAVLTAGRIAMKVTNAGHVGNAYINLSSDPGGQWPGYSGVEYLNFIMLAVGAVNRAASNPGDVHRVSQFIEWRPATNDPVDRIYTSFEGIPGGATLVNDDGDVDPSTGVPRVDEDFPDGRDDDGDGLVDEDYAALGEQMYSCVMRDDTPAALAYVTSEKHVPLGLECRQLAWAYSIPGLDNFNAVAYTIVNRSGHVLDSLYVGFFADMDAGPSSRRDYYLDDLDVPSFPNGQYAETLDDLDPLVMENGCSKRAIHLHGFSVVDNDGDQGATPGVGSLLLLGHTVDPLGVKAPRRVGFHSFRSFVRGTPYTSDGAPASDQQRYELMSGGGGVDPSTGEVVAEAGEQPGDYAAWASVGPFLQVPDGGSVSVTIGFAVSPGSALALRDYRRLYLEYRAGELDQSDLFYRYPALQNAYTAQVAYEGIHEPPRPGFEKLVPTCRGCETPLRLPAGSRLMQVAEHCPDREEIVKTVTDTAYTWFDFDCDVCTGVRGYYLRHWNAPAPPPSPALNVAAAYNYADHPGRVVAAGDRQVTLAWDNRSETTPDPLSRRFDFRSYRIWKVAGWKRRSGTSAPNDRDWSMLGEFRLFDYADSNFTSAADCPKVFVPNYEYPAGDPHCSRSGSTVIPLSGGGCRDTATVGICLRNGDLWSQQSGQVLRPDDSVDCVRDPAGRCVTDRGHPVDDFVRYVERTRYPVGRYRFVDREVMNGFLYLYSVTAGDSTEEGERFGQRSAVESEAVVPQAAVRTGKGVWVVPNPYRGYRDIEDRPSAWDLSPNATDPTGTHIDFMGLPRGRWRIRIYTVSGDLVTEIHSDDPVNASVRSDVTDESGNLHPGFNRQQDNPNDGQARWNLLSRNGQDIVSGIYVFVVDSSQGQQRGKFVVIR